MMTSESRRLRPTLFAIVAALVLGLLLWNGFHRANEAQAILDRMDRDVTAAKAAAAAAEGSANEAQDAARKAQNALPGSS